MFNVKNVLESCRKLKADTFYEKIFIIFMSRSWLGLLVKLMDCKMLLSCASFFSHLIKKCHCQNNKHFLPNAGRVIIQRMFHFLGYININLHLVIYIHNERERKGRCLLLVRLVRPRVVC